MGAWTGLSTLPSPNTHVYVTGLVQPVGVAVAVNDTGAPATATSGTTAADVSEQPPGPLPTCTVTVARFESVEPSQAA